MLEIRERKARDTHGRWALLNNGEHAALDVLDSGRTVASVLTGMDRRAERLSGTHRGYFALFEAECRPDAVRLLFDEVERRQRAWGSGLLFGPVAPDGSALNMGVMVRGFEHGPELLNPYNPEWYDALLTGAGLCPDTDWLGFRLRMDELCRRRYEKAADWAQARRGISVRPLDLRRGKPAYERLRCAMEAEQRLSLRDFAAGIEPFRRYLDGRLLLLAEVAGAPAGMLLALRDSGTGNVRIVTLHIRARYRRTPVALCLFGRLVERLRDMRVHELTASVIDAANVDSIACVLGAGGEAVRSWRQYTKMIHRCPKT